MFYYAQINEENICHAVSDLSGEVIANNMIPLESYDISLLGKRYENGEWIEVPQPEEQPARPSFEERMTELEEVINELLNA